MKTRLRSIFPRPVPSIIPPFIVSSVAKNGSASQRQRALATLNLDATLRHLRATPNRKTTSSARAASLNEEGIKHRTICTAENAEMLPGSIIRIEGGASTGDIACDEAYEGLGATYDLFWDVFDRNSIDDEGMRLDATVHFGDDYNNAFWNGERMVFGDGDGELFNRFTSCIDIIGHELAHGVTEDEAGLQYLLQPGALNESLSDVFGSLVKQRQLNQTADKADWLIGQGLFTSQIQGVALRSMKHPGTAYDDPVIGKDPQPAHMKDYVRTYQDNGGVHINSGIPNRAFCLCATEIGGYAWEKAGRIWYETLRDSRLRRTTGFRRFARLTASNAIKLFGQNSNEHKAVTGAWHKVGINI